MAGAAGASGGGAHSGDGYSLLNTYAPVPSTERGQPVHMGADPKGERFVYVSARNVVIRSVSNPLQCEIYTEHASDTSVAKISPSGFYCASGDTQGKIRIWDLANPDQTHILKIELPVLAGAVKDLAWSEDSKRIVAVGEGREVFGAAFMFDSGSTVGTISGHSKQLTSCDFKPSRPYRVVTGGLDTAVGFFQGPPFKFDHSCKDHTRFVNALRFSPDGARFCSVGSDKNMFFYDGKAGTRLADCGVVADGDKHKAGIYSVSWRSNDKVLTASADKTARLYDVASGACDAVFEFADKPGTEHQQLGCLCVGEHMLSVSLGGDVSYLDAAAPQRPRRVLHGHNKNITAIAYDAAADALFTGDFSGKVVRWDVQTGSTSLIAGAGHTNQIRRLLVRGKYLVSTAMDDSVRVTALGDSGAQMAYSDAGSAATDGLPCDVGASDDGSLVAVATNRCVQIVQGAAEGAARVVATIKTDGYEASSVAVAPDGSEVAVGGGERDHKVRIYAAGSYDAPKATLDKHRGPVTSVAYSADGKLLATSCKKNDIFVWTRPDYALKIEGWCFHTAPPLRILFSPDSSRVVSASLDSSVYVWSVATPEKRVQMKRAHPLGVSDIAWLNDNQIASTGFDACTRTWQLK